MKVLLVDDDLNSLDSTRRILEFAGHEVITAVDGKEAIETLRRAIAQKIQVDVVVSDVRMPRMDGLEFLSVLSATGDSVPVVLMTAFGRVEDAVFAMRAGACDFLSKPFKRQQLLESINQAIQMRPAKKISQNLLLGQGTGVQSLRDMIAKVAPTAATVLICGESGTGKEIVARALHSQSVRCERPFIALNCAAIPESLIESELFGHEKGAFTGAESAKVGIFEAAHGGTLFLDEIGDMPLSAQAKLLRVLQENEVRRIGSVQSRKIDVRLIAATHQSLSERVVSGLFRQDLLYRLEVVKIETTPLRDRMEDLPILVEEFLLQACHRHGKSLRISNSALEALLNHSWPGNIRELSNVIERGVIMCQGGQLEVQDLPSHFGNSRKGEGFVQIPIGATLKDVEEILIRKTLEATSGDKSLTAKMLGIHSRTIHRRLSDRK